MKKTNDYIKGVLDGSIITGNYVRQAVERHVKDREDGKGRGLEFDTRAAADAMKFFETYLCHSKGEWAGSPFILQGWQRFVVASLFGWKRGKRRRFKTAYVEVSRKNGKSTLGAGIGLYLTVRDREPGGEIYSIATKMDQAKIVHSEAVRMTESSPELGRFTRVMFNKILCPKLQSKYEPLGSDSKTLDGLNISGGICDELHAWPSRHLWDVITTATSARSQPLIFSISTAGYERESLCYEQRKYALKVLDGTLEDDKLFAFIATLDDQDDWNDKTTWPKANPSLGTIFEIDDLQEHYEKAIEDPSSQNAFKRYRLNLWTEAESVWLPMDRWDACKGDFDATTSQGLAAIREALRGKACLIGLDLSSTQDLTAAVLVFPPDSERSTYTVLPWFFVPERTMTLKERTDRVPYSLWARQGFIEATQGDVVDYTHVKTTIKKLIETYNVTQLAFDPWNATMLITQLVEETGLTVVDIQQSIRNISPAVKEVERLILSEQIAHGGNPVLRWNASNAMMVSDINENRKLTKKRSAGRIDGVAALITATARLLRDPPPPPSIYEDHGLTMIEV